MAKTHIAILDLLNLARSFIANRGDAKFINVEEFGNYIEQIAHKLKILGDFDKIFIVTKSVKFNGKVNYTDILRIIFWSFCRAIPEWENRYVCVVVNGINDNDKGADDRALFLLYDEIYQTIYNAKISIISDDMFRDLSDHLALPLILTFYRIDEMAAEWNKTVTKRISSPTHIFKQKMKNSEFNILRFTTGDKYVLQIE